MKTRICDKCGNVGKAFRGATCDEVGWQVLTMKLGRFPTEYMDLCTDCAAKLGWSAGPGGEQPTGQQLLDLIFELIANEVDAQVNP